MNMPNMPKVGTELEEGLLLVVLILIVGQAAVGQVRNSPSHSFSF